jgi:hypothetical protein
MFSACIPVMCVGATHIHQSLRFPNNTGKENAVHTPQQPLRFPQQHAAKSFSRLRPLATGLVHSRFRQLANRSEDFLPTCCLYFSGKRSSVARSKVPPAASIMLKQEDLALLKAVSSVQGNPVLLRELRKP